jgi:hypothetical protein
MKKILLLFVIALFLPLTSSFSQPVFYTESFEAYDSLTFPAGWMLKYHRPYGPNDWSANWRVRDTGTAVPGLSSALAKAYDGKKGLGVSWWMLDTVESIADTWIITKQFNNLPTDALLTFWACGGTPSYSDSMQVLISPTGDTAFSSFIWLESYHWPVGSVYGNFTQNIIDLSMYGGQNPRLAFRYWMDCTTNGFVVYVDKVQMLGTIGITPIGSNIPREFALHQNYPNPFNPATKIKFDIPRNTDVTLEVYNSLGQVVQTLYKGYANAGYYETDFNATGLPSGAYFYRLVTRDFTQVKKMMLVK